MRNINTVSQCTASQLHITTKEQLGEILGHKIQPGHQTSITNTGAK